MNIRRGLFRLWLVSSVLFVGIVGILSYSDIRTAFTAGQSENADTDKWGGYLLLPDNCAGTRGTSPNDYTISEGLCWYTVSAFRRLYPEYNDLTNNRLSDALYAKVGRTITHTHPWQTIRYSVEIAFGVPLGTLLLGWSLIWAFAGFRNALGGAGKAGAQPPPL